jgi:prolyl-tRNA synthetase
VRAASVAKKAKNAQRSTDYKAHYFANDRAIFILFSRFTPVDFANALLKGIPHLLELGPKYFVSNSLFFAGLVTAATTRNERCHQFYAIFFLFQTTIIGFTIFHTLS